MCVCIKVEVRLSCHGCHRSDVTGMYIQCVHAARKPMLPNQGMLQVHALNAAIDSMRMVMSIHAHWMLGTIDKIMESAESGIPRDYEEHFELQRRHYLGENQDGRARSRACLGCSGEQGL